MASYTMGDGNQISDSDGSHHVPYPEVPSSAHTAEDCPHNYYPLEGLVMLFSSQSIYNMICDHSPIWKVRKPNESRKLSLVFMLMQAAKSSAQIIIQKEVMPRGVQSLLCLLQFVICQF